MRKAVTGQRLMAAKKATSPTAAEKAGSPWVMTVQLAPSSAPTVKVGMISPPRSQSPRHTMVSSAFTANGGHPPARPASASESRLAPVPSNPRQSNSVTSTAMSTPPRAAHR